MAIPEQARFAPYYTIVALSDRGGNWRTWVQIKWPQLIDNPFGCVPLIGADYGIALCTIHYLKYESNLFSCTSLKV